MELEFQDDRRRGKIVIALGVILALVAGAGAYFALTMARQQAGQENLARVPAVVAVSVIPARQPITEDQVAIREVPVDDTNLNGIASSIDEVVGRVPAVAILQGQLVTTNMLASSAEGDEFSILGPDESVGPDSEFWRAVSITVPDDLAVGGMLRPGQTVDVFVTTVVSVPQDMVDSGEFYSDRSTKVTYENMLILARSEAFYVVRASLDVAEEIAHLQASGAASFSVALRPDVDQRPIDTDDLGETTNRIIEKYGIPIPEPVDDGGRRLGPPAPPTGPAPTPVPSVAPSAEPAAAPFGAEPSASPAL